MTDQVTTTYVTKDGNLWMNVVHPPGLIPPPMFNLHRPFEGPVVFYFAQCYGIPIPPEATCEPYKNGKGWWHTPGCEHVDWSD